MDITWRDRALDDLEEVGRYIAEHDPPAATRIRERIFSVVGNLAMAPQLGRPGRIAETRELVIPHTPYTVAYAVISGEVVILDVLHEAREWPEGFG